MISTGKITLEIGPMFAGKSSALINAALLAENAGQRVRAFKSKLDGRYHQNHIASHDGLTYPAASIGDLRHLIAQVRPTNTDVIVFDEIHFFSDNLLHFIWMWARAGMDVHLAGVDADFNRELFGVVAKTIPMAHCVNKRLAKCAKCLQPAQFAHLKTETSGRFLVGGADDYEPRCMACWDDK